MTSAGMFPKIGPLMDDAKVEVLAFTSPEDETHPQSRERHPDKGKHWVNIA